MYLLHHVPQRAVIAAALLGLLLGSPPAAQQRSTLPKPAAPLATEELSDARHASRSGWILLDGELLTPPFTIEQGPGCLYVNGVVAFAPPRARGSPPPTAQDVARHELLQDLTAAYGQLCTSTSAESAREQLLELAMACALVADARWESDSCLYVQVAGARRVREVGRLATHGQTAP